MSPQDTLKKGAANEEGKSSAIPTTVQARVRSMKEILI